MTATLGAIAAVGWAVAYALPWAGAILVGGWSWRRLRPRSLLLAWAGATCLALVSLLVFAMLLVAVIEALAPPLSA